jgi:hypothetical protein
MVCQIIRCNSLFLKKWLFSLTCRSCYINKDSMENFINIIKNETWESTYSMNQVNGIFNAFLNAFLIHSESCFSVYYVTGKHKTDWITTDITSFKRKLILYNFSKISNCPLFKSYYYYYCSILKKVTRNAKASYYNNIITSTKNKLKTSWNILKKNGYIEE